MSGADKCRKIFFKNLEKDIDVCKKPWYYVRVAFEKCDNRQI